MAWNPDVHLESVFNHIKDQEQVSHKEIVTLIKVFCGVQREKTVLGIVERWRMFKILKATDNPLVYEINFVNNPLVEVIRKRGVEK